MKVHILVKTQRYCAIFFPSGFSHEANKTIPTCRQDVRGGAFTLGDNLFKQITSSVLDHLH